MFGWKSLGELIEAIISKKKFCNFSHSFSILYSCTGKVVFLKSFSAIFYPVLLT